MYWLEVFCKDSVHTVFNEDQLSPDTWPDVIVHPLEFSHSKRLPPIGEMPEPRAHRLRDEELWRMSDTTSRWSTRDRSVGSVGRPTASSWSSRSSSSTVSMTTRRTTTTWRRPTRPASAAASGATAAARADPTIRSRLISSRLTDITSAVRQHISHFRPVFIRINHSVLSHIRFVPVIIFPKSTDPVIFGSGPVLPVQDCLPTHWHWRTSVLYDRRLHRSNGRQHSIQCYLRRHCDLNSKSCHPFGQSMSTCTDKIKAIPHRNCEQQFLYVSPTSGP